MRLGEVARKCNLISIGLERLSDYFAYQDASAEYYQNHKKFLEFGRPEAAESSGLSEILQMITSYLAHPFFGERISEERKGL